MNSLSSLWTFLLHRGRVAFLIALMGAIWGLKAYDTMPRESAPDVEVPVGIITTALPGASSQDIEQLITEKIEREVKKLERVKKYTSTSRNSLSIVVVEFEAGSDMIENMQKLREALDDAEASLPDTIPDDPDLQEASANNLPILSLNVSGDFSLSELKRFGKQLQEDFESVRGVKEVLISGLPKEAFHIYLDPIKLQNFGFSVEEISLAIRNAHRDIPMGSVVVDGNKIDLRLEGELETVLDFYELPIGYKNQQIIQLSDIAEVRREFDNLEVKTLFSTGKPLQPSLTLDVIKSEAKTNIARVVGEIKALLADYRAQEILPPHLETSIIFNSADDIQKDLNRLIVTGLQTLILIAVILWIVLGWRESLLALISIPLSMLISVGVLQAIGETFNFLSLFSLILAVGLLVDNAIIIVEGVSENIFYHHQSPIKAAANALVTFRWPVITGTCTTIFAFLPMIFLISGVSGQYIQVIPITVTIVLLASLFVALFIIPVFAAFFFTIIPPQPHQEDTYLDKVKQWYQPRMKHLLSSKRKVYITLSLSLITFIFSVALVVTGNVPVEIFPGSDENFFTAKIELPKGTDLTQTSSLIPNIEKAILPLFQANEGSHPLIKNVVTTVGQVSNFDPEVLRGEGGTPEEEVIGMTFNIYDKKERLYSSSQIAQKTEEALRKVLPPYATISMGELESGPPSGSSQIEIRLISQDLEHLEKVTDDLREKLAKMELRNGTRLDDITDDRGEIVTQITWHIDREKLQRFGLTLHQISQTLFASIEGIKTLQLTEGDEEIDVDMRIYFESNQGVSTPLNWKDPQTLDIVGAIPIKTPVGNYITLEDITDFSIGPQRSIIRHQDGDRTVKVGADIKGKGTASQFLGQLEEALAQLDKRPGDRFEIGGDNEESNRLVGEMGNAMILAVFLIGIILVLQFNSFSQPLVIVAAIPLSITAVFLGFWISQTPLSFPTMIGIVALAGIIVNDDIVLIDQINHHHKKEKNGNLSPSESQDLEHYINALINGCMARMQPIFLTSITTVIGLLPLALSDPIWRGLGFAIIYGMSLSTVLTLLLTPCILLTLKNMTDWTMKRIRRA